MFSSNKNIESISQLIEEIKHYIGLQKDYVKLDVVEKTVVLLSALILWGLLLVLAAMVLFYFSFAAAYFLSDYIGFAGGFTIITAFCLLIFILVYAFRKKWIERPLTKFLANLLLRNDEDENE
jgi:hypothetical protein